MPRRRRPAPAGPARTSPAPATRTASSPAAALAAARAGNDKAFAAVSTADLWKAHAIARAALREAEAADGAHPAGGRAAASARRASPSAAHPSPRRAR